MNSIKKTFTFFLVAISLCSQAQDIFKIRPFSSVGNDYCWAAAMDSEANLYLSFSLHPNRSDSINMNNDLFYDSLLNGAFLAKLDENRNLLWVIETPYTIHNIEVASSNDIIVSGYGGYRFYVSMLSSSGTTLWEVNESVSSSMVPYDMILDESDNIYITGNVEDWEVFGLDINNDGCCLNHDFLAKFNSSGDFQWIIASRPGKIGFGRNLTMDDNGRIYLIGAFTYSLNFDGYSFGDTQGYENSYLARVSSSGNVQYVVGYGGKTGHLNISNINWHNSGNILFGGSFTGTVQIGDSTITSLGKSDLIYGSFSSNGDINWFNHVGTSASENLNHLVINGDNFLLSGHTSAQLEIDSYSINPEGIDGKSFILKSSVGGSLVWVKELSSSNVESVSRAYPLNNRNLIIPISETKNLIYGSFIPEIAGFNQVYNSRSQDLYTAILDENCSNVELTTDGDLAFNLCPNESIEVNLSIPNSADSYSVDLLEGDVNFEFQGDLLQISELESQYARLRLHVENCRSEAFQNITLFKKQEPSPPEINGTLNWCMSNIANASLSVSGENIRWYRSESLNDPIAVGNEYKITNSETLFVTQTVDDCESQPSDVPIHVEVVPPAPNINQIQYVTCLDSELMIDLSPNQYNWYDADMTFLKTSSSIDITTAVIGSYNYHLTSTGTLCESPPTSINIEVIAFDMNDVFIPNVFTPNGDGLNDYFSLPTFKSEDCVGPFQYFKVIDRSGTLFYENRKRDFKWYAKNQVSGVYYYVIKFQNREFKGPLSIIK